MASAMMTETMELLARASSTSEVLTLNLTNLLILLVLKALIFGFGLFSFGGTGRSADSQQGLVSETDITGGSCFLMYTAGVDAKLSCIKRVACEDRPTAYSYKTAAKMAHGMSKYLGMDLSARHLAVLEALDEAIKHSENNGDCTVYKYL